MTSQVRMIADHVESRKVVLWAHNTHVGDPAAATARRVGEITVGQQLRSEGGVFSVGMLTERGLVRAALYVDTPDRVMRIRPALPESYSAVFAQAPHPSFWLLLEPGSAVTAALTPPRLERAIGVRYSRPTERPSHYMRTSLPREFDAVIFLRQTHAVTPMRDRPARAGS